MASGTVSKKQFDKMVDEALILNGVPRRELNEYPVNEFESRDRLNRAEASVNRMLKTLGLTRE